jgi:hypothetical protein
LAQAKNPVKRIAHPDAAYASRATEPLTPKAAREEKRVDDVDLC